MSTCNTCGNNTSLPCGCEDIALTMSCTDLIGLNCGSDVNQCASIECAECVVSCGQEDMWSTQDQYGQGTYVYMQGWSMLQYMQSTAVINASGMAALTNGYFTLFTSSETTPSSVKLKWSYLADASVLLPTAFQIEYREVADPIGDWVIAATSPYGNTTLTISAANVPLTAGLQYQFRIRTVSADGTVPDMEYQSVWLNVTLPN